MFESSQRISPITDEQQHRLGPLVTGIATKFRRGLPSTIAVEDLISVGWIACISGLRSHPGLVGNELAYWASVRIRGALIDYLRKRDVRTRPERDKLRELERATHRLQMSLCRHPSVLELATEMGISIDDVYRIRDTDTRRATDLSLCLIADAAPNHDWLVTPSVAAAVEQIPERLRLVLALRYQEECSLQEIAAVFGVTESRACQLHKEALTQVRKRLERRSCAS